MRTRRSPAVSAMATATVLIAATACASEREEPGDGDRLVIGTAGEITMLDPTYSPDGETIRVALQIYDTLLGITPGTVETEPRLAESWESDEAGTEWTFQLRQGVEFHDGEPFNADAVCANFERWHNLTGSAQDADKSYYWIQMSGGFAENEPDRADLGEPNYQSCTPTDEHTAVVNLARPSSKFPALLVLPTFSMHSPAAMEQYNAASVGAETVEEDGEETVQPVWPPYALEHPTGTGPFQFVRWDRANREIHLERNDNYWGGPAGVSELIFRAIPDETQRVEALLTGVIDGFDLPSPAHWDTLEAEGMNLMVRDTPVNLLYVAFTPTANPALEDIRVRQAIAHAFNREGLVGALMPEGAKVATQFQPPSLPGWAADVQTYEYNPELARDLLEQAGFDEDNPLEVDFYWPTEVTRPYMPSPRDMIELFQQDLEDVGIVVEPVSLPWSPEYLADVQAGEADLHFLGWTGDYPEAYNFIGTWHSRFLPQWGYQYPELFDRMSETPRDPPYWMASPSPG
jgi:peptide/nickel transport system substrate-binding protein